MQSALYGLYVGIALGLGLLIFEYMAISRAVNERSKKYHTKAEFDVTDKRRMSSMIRFAFVLPFGFAVVFWLISLAQ
jgi:hypothetical protein